MLKQIFKRGLNISSKALAYNHPITSKEMLRAGGIASMYRLPVYKNTDGKVYTFFKLVIFFLQKACCNVSLYGFESRRFVSPFQGDY